MRNQNEGITNEKNELKLYTVDIFKMVHTVKVESTMILEGRDKCGFLYRKPELSMIAKL